MGGGLPQAEWAAAVDEAISSFEKSPFVFTAIRKTQTRGIILVLILIKTNPFLSKGRDAGRCPYYFVVGEGDAARAQIGGILATVVPLDKKIIHGMTDAVAPYMVSEV